MNDHQSHDPAHNDSHAGHPHDHTHGTLDPALLTTQRGIWALKWSFVGLLATAFFQLGVVIISDSVALLADTIHNFGDAATALPLWIAFIVARKKPTNRFTYGYGRVEDLAGIAVVFAIFISGVVVGYESLSRLFTPHPVEYLWAVVVASVVGFLGNEAVAGFCIKVGKEIGSAALVAEGQHARYGWTGESSRPRRGTRRMVWVPLGRPAHWPSDYSDHLQNRMGFRQIPLHATPRRCGS